MSPDTVELLTSLIATWVEGQPDLLALALAGSWARGNPRPDSDLDVLILTSDQDRYRQDHAWLGAAQSGERVRIPSNRPHPLSRAAGEGGEGVHQQQPLPILPRCAGEGAPLIPSSVHPLPPWLSAIGLEAAGYRVVARTARQYGVVWSWHLHLEPDAELELSFANPDWAKTNPIDAGTDRVVKDALQVLIDKDGRLSALVARRAAPPPSLPPMSNRGRPAHDRN
jgi:hypothetical protein